MKINLWIVNLFIIFLVLDVVFAQNNPIRFSDIQLQLESAVSKLNSNIKEKNRKKFYEIRLESLETSIKQIDNMHKQIQINYTILPPGFFEEPLVDAEHQIIRASVASLEKCVELLKSVNQK